MSFRVAGVIMERASWDEECIGVDSADGSPSQ
jgi:hypothetical protein